MKTTDIKRGGVRPGAGRKCLAPEARRAGVSLSITSDTARKLRELRECGYPINKVLETIISKSYRACVLCRIERLDLDNKGIFSDASFEDFAYPE